MDAVKFAKEFYRMVDYHTGCCIKCADCEIYKRLTAEGFETCRKYFKDFPERVVEVVEKWSKEHPLKTNAQKFEEVYGFAPFSRNVKGDNVSRFICPPFAVRGNCKGGCIKCEAWWNQIYTKPKAELL